MLDLIYTFVICLSAFQIYLCIISCIGIQKYNSSTNKSIPKKKRKRTRTPPRKSRRPKNIKIIK